MMTARRFIPSRSLNGALAMGDKSGGLKEVPIRSETNATDATQSFPSEARSPLASHKPDTKPGVTFAAQDSLPKLPIPDLDATCNRYLEALEPLQSAREHRESKSAVRDFLRSEGPELQERLKKYATGKSSYIEQFCKGSVLVVIV